jgi:hypothetical protein
MGLEGLEDLSQNCTLLKQIVETGHVHRIEQVYLEKVVVSDIVAKEGHSLDQADVCHKG